MILDRTAPNTFTLLSVGLFLSTHLSGLGLLRLGRLLLVLLLALGFDAGLPARLLRDVGHDLRLAAGHRDLHGLAVGPATSTDFHAIAEGRRLDDSLALYRLRRELEEVLQSQR